MLKYIMVVAILLSSTAATAQASAPAPSASAPTKHKWVKKLKEHKPGQPAVDPETSPDKKGGN